MLKLLNWFSWISAIVLAIVLALAQMAFSKQSSGQDGLSFFRVVFFIIIAIASQFGLFVSPWAVNWRSSFQKLVFALMLPSIIWLVGQLRSDLNDVLRGVEEGHISEYGIEIGVLLFILAVYVAQLVRVSVRFLKQPSVKPEE